MLEPWAHAIDRLHPESLKKPPQHVRRHGSVARNRGTAVASEFSRPAAGRPLRPIPQVHFGLADYTASSAFPRSAYGRIFRNSAAISCS